MRYTPFDSALFVENRRRLAAALPPGSLAVVQSNDPMPTNADGLHPFRQNTDLFYLTGVDQPETVLVLFPDHPDETMREVLFIQQTNKRIAVWEGARLTREEARKATGIRTVHWSGSFDTRFRPLMIQAEAVYLNHNEHPRAAALVETRSRRFIRECREQFPLHRYERLAPLLTRLRMIKTPLEVERIRTAIEITEAGFRRVLGFLAPGVMEYELEAEYIHEFLRRRSRGFAFGPIMAGGANACVLHYEANDAELRDGDLVLMDVGAEYAGYNADLTRTVPVNGRFTDRQRAVYEAVRAVQRRAMELLRPGVQLKAYHDDVNALMDEKLVGLGLLTSKDVSGADAAKPHPREKYFMHGCSHHLGLDVHDVGHAYTAVEPGMVFTVEPGIYIRDEGLGIRLENDILIGETENTDLMASIPIEPDEIEALMAI